MTKTRYNDGSESRITVTVPAGGAAAAAGGGNCLIATGTYTGDDTVAQAIIGVGFQPIVAVVMRDPAAQDLTGPTMFVKVDEHDADLSCYVPMGETYDNRLISLDADGFTVDDDGGNQHPNMNNFPYLYIAWGEV